MGERLVAPGRQRDPPGRSQVRLETPHPCKIITQGVPNPCGVKSPRERIPAPRSQPLRGHTGSAWASQGAPRGASEIHWGAHRCRTRPPFHAKQCRGVSRHPVGSNARESDSRHPLPGRSGGTPGATRRARECPGSRRDPPPHPGCFQVQSQTPFPCRILPQGFPEPCGIISLRNQPAAPAPNLLWGHAGGAWARPGAPRGAGETPPPECSQARPRTPLPCEIMPQTLPRPCGIKCPRKRIPAPRSKPLQGARRARLGEPGGAPGRPRDSLGCS